MCVTVCVGGGGGGGWGSSVVKADASLSLASPSHFLGLFIQPNGWSLGCQHSIFVIHLTLPMLQILRPKHKDTKLFENHLNPVMMVFIGKLSPITLI